MPPDAVGERLSLLRSILGKCSDEGFLNIESPFFCDYGYNIEIGKNFFAYYNFVVLDVAKVRIGDNFMAGPNVGIYTAGHPVHPKTRNSGYEYGMDITIGNNVWIGGHVCIMPGVTIGDNVVIAGGSVVTKNISNNMIAAGNPCQVIREITDVDIDFYYRDRKFDVSYYK